jgi:hypothetical protein
MESSMMLYLTNVPINRLRCTRNSDLCWPRHIHTAGCASALSERRENAASMRRNHWLPLAWAVATLLVVGTAIPVLAQTPTTAYADVPPAQSPDKPISPARMVWMKGRCSQLVAFFDYYGVSRGENSDGPRNHTRISATIECERTHMRTGIKAMEALLKRKAFDIPKPGIPEVEPEDTEAPDITRPTSQGY